MIKVVLADDHTIIRDGLKLMLSESGSKIKVVGEVSSGEELIELLTDIEADVVLLDIFMPGMNGLQAASHLVEHFPTIKIIILTVTNNEKYIREALQVGVSGYLLKTADETELTQAIESVTYGKKYISSQITIDLLTNKELKLPYMQSTLNKHSLLSKRELEVLKLISEGFTNAEIAEKLFISKRTIEIHRQNMLEKTSTRNTANLISYAFYNRLLYAASPANDKPQSDFAK